MCFVKLVDLSQSCVSYSEIGNSLLYLYFTKIDS